jgi:alpha,alpha-trehalase
VPVDLNCLLYKYETDFNRWYTIHDNLVQASEWSKKAKTRGQRINEHLFNGFYLDWDIKREKTRKLRSLAGYSALWAGLADIDQASAMVENLKLFETKYGLTNTEKIPWTGKQWDYPNGWPPLQLITIQGLINYGFLGEAERIGNKWLRLNLKVFQETGQMWEKYNVVSGEIGQAGGYTTQPGFSWTNSVFLVLQELIK